MVGSHKLSKEEQLLRERQRMAEIGVTSYFFTPDSATTEKILVPTGDQLLIAEKGKENAYGTIIN